MLPTRLPKPTTPLLDAGAQATICRPVQVAAAAIVRCELPKPTALVTLTALETVAALAKAADMALVGPVIYDALIVACARKVKATAIYTYNGDDFRRVAPDLASIIHEP